MALYKSTCVDFLSLHIYASVNEYDKKINDKITFHLDPADS
jgi:hypothetical protein